MKTIIPVRILACEQKSPIPLLCTQATQLSNTSKHNWLMGRGEIEEHNKPKEIGKKK